MRIFTSTNKGKNEGKEKLYYLITNNEKVIGLKDMLKFCYDIEDLLFFTYYNMYHNSIATLVIYFPSPVSI